MYYALMADRPYSHLELTAESVKVLAHPLRSRILGALRRHGPATATALATELGTNSGATSYHLRRLESVGLVEDTGEGRGKERLWKTSTASHGWRNTAFAEDEDARTALGWLVRDYLRQFDTRYAHWLDIRETWPAEWQDALSSGDAWIEVTAPQLRAFNAELEELIVRYLRAGEGDPQARRVHVHHFELPLDPGEVPDGDAGGGE